jgi:hypothetical protein
MKQIIYLDKVDGINMDTLIIDDTFSISNNYSFYKDKGLFEEYWLPNKILIMIIIKNAKATIESTKNEKNNINKIKTHIQKMDKLIKFIDYYADIDNLEDDDILYRFNLIDGTNKEKQIARESYVNARNYADKQLKILTQDIRIKTTTIRKECRNKISLILKNDGIVKHLATATHLLALNHFDLNYKHIHN